MSKYFELSKEEEQRALDLHNKSIVIEANEATHQDEFDEEFVDIRKREGIDAVVITLSPSGNLETVVSSICDWYSIIENNAEKTILVNEAKDVGTSKEKEKLGIIIGIQNPSAISSRGFSYGSGQGDLRFLNILHKLGLRVMTLAYNYRSSLANGCAEKKDCGLSAFGVKVVNEMNRIGMLIDLSHVGKVSSLEAIELSKDPVLFSHSMSRVLNDHYRAIDDEQIKALAENGGFIGIPGLSGFLIPGGFKTGCTINDYIDHIDFIANLVGVDYVGIGTDIRKMEKSTSFTAQKQIGRIAGIQRKEMEVHKSDTVGLTPDIKYPKGLSDGRTVYYSNISRGLVARGYSDIEIQKILGLNFMRVYKQVCG
ncbi:dipeptidase [Thermoproteota archaeon]